MTINATSFIHFNDIYNIEKSPPFVTSVKKTRKDLKATGDAGEKGRHVITIFSGDAFSPSIMSTVLRGEQMIPVLNALDIDVACLGNHDLDFGTGEFQALRDRCNFPWICSNAWDTQLGAPLGGCFEYFIIDKSKDGGPKILTIGLIEEAWLDTLISLDPGVVMFEQPSDFVKRRLPEIRKELGPFDAIVAVTHMRIQRDIILAESGGVDIILGGHDHHYESIVVNGIRVLNSGTDFQTHTVVDVVERNSSGGLDTKSRRVDVSSDDEPDAAVVEEIQEFQNMLNKSMGKVLGKSKVPLDARFSETRTKETNIGNYLAELMTRATEADIAIFNAGTFRADRIIDAGDLTMRDLCDLLPMAEELQVVELTAERLLLALENGVSQYPAMEGRFPCVDGVRFEFDPSKPPGSRVVPGSVYVRSRPLVRRHHIMIRGQLSPMNDSVEEKQNSDESYSHNATFRGFSPLDFDRTYAVVSKAYLITGKDGYDKAFVGAPILKDEEECPILPNILRNVFTQLRTLQFWSGLSKRGSVISAASKFKMHAGQGIVDPFAIDPRVDGRIKMVEEGMLK